MPLFSIEKLTVEIGTPDGIIRPVEDVSWDVNEGETVAIVGESGSGKSITALAAMGLLPPAAQVTGGRIVFRDEDLLQFTPDAMRSIRGSRIAMVFQEPMTSLNPVRSIGVQLIEGMRLNLGMVRKDAEARAVELLGFVGISEPEQRLRQYPHHLSGGMRQRVMIAIALSCKPDLIIADEPTTALDVTIQAQILSLMQDLSERLGVALVIITHNLGIVARYADRVNVMYGGRLAECGEAGEVYESPKHPYTLGLLASVPRLDRPKSVPFEPIPGSPPDPGERMPGCRFAPRCRFASDQCRNEVPPLVRHRLRSRRRVLALRQACRH